jgi:CRP-like cAMP-binding protein
VPGNLFGLVSAIDSGKRSASCVTTGPAKLLKLSDKDFDHLFASGHRFAFQIVDLVARQLVGHLRQTNAMVPALGKPAAATAPSAPMTALLATPAQEMAETDLDLIPLELEMDVDEIALAGDILG